MTLTTSPIMVVPKARGGPHGTTGPRSPVATPAGLATGAAVAVLVVLGVVARLWLLAHDPMDADQAVVGLMARAIVHGHLPAFFWGQDYGGVEAYVTAAGVALFGLHPWVVDATPSLLAALAAVVAWRLGRALTGSSGAGAVAGAATWAWSESNLWSSTREYGFAGILLLCTLLAALAAVRIVDRTRHDLRPEGTGRQAVAATGHQVPAVTGHRTGAPTDRLAAGRLARLAGRHVDRQAAWRAGAARWWPWLTLGGAVGLGWWASPEILAVAVPVVAVAGWATWRAVQRSGRAGVLPLVAASAAGVVAVLPWLVASVHDGFASLSVASPGQRVAGLGYGGRLQAFFVHTLPTVLGARLPATGRWLGGPVVGALVLTVTAALLATGLLAATRAIPAARVLAAALACSPFVEAAIGPTAAWQDARYGALVVPLAVVGAVAGGYRALTGLRRQAARRRPLRVASWAGVALCALAAASTVASLDAATAVPAIGADSGFAASPTALSGHPNAVAVTVAASLVRHHLTRAYADYWAAYDLDLVGGTALAVSPPDIVRDVQVADVVARAHTAAWLFVGPTAADAAACGRQFQNPSPQPLGLTAAAFAAGLHAHGIASRIVTVGPMVAVVPAVNVPPGWVRQHVPGAS